MAGRGHTVINVKLSLYLAKHHAIKTESGGIAPRILNLDTGWRWVVIFTPQSLCPQYPLDMRLGRSQSWFGHGGEEKKILFLSGTEPGSSSPYRSHYIY
jgi:hypothetical protein